MAGGAGVLVGVGDAVGSDQCPAGWAPSPSEAA